jgi:multidrug efflux pump subunit AcrB
MRQTLLRAASRGHCPWRSPYTTDDSRSDEHCLLLCLTLGPYYNCAALCQNLEEAGRNITLSRIYYPNLQTRSTPIRLLVWFLHETINIMTLGGLALAVGILVDDATVTIENIERHLEEGAELHDGILEGAAQIAVPALVSTLCICIVFLPMFFLSGVARYLFVPLAEAVIFAMIASYILFRTLVPTLAMYLLKAHKHEGTPSRSVFSRFQRGFEQLLEKIRSSYSSLLTQLVSVRLTFVPSFIVVCVLAFVLVPFLGQDFFPDTDSGQFILHARAKTGTRIEETARLADQVEGSIRKTIPSSEMDNILDNIGLPYSNINYVYNRSGLTGAADADILVSLKEKHHRTTDYVRVLRDRLPREYPGVTFYFLPADIVAAQCHRRR